MTRLLLPLLLAGCLPDREVLAPVAAAWGEQVASEAAPASQAALGMAAVSAALCGYSLEEWEAMGTVAPTLPEEIASIFAIEEPGALRAYAARGQFACTWSGSFFDREIALHLAVETPTSDFAVSLEEPGSGVEGDGDTGEPEGAVILAAMTLGTSRCGTAERVVAGQGSFPIGGTRGWVVATTPGADTGGLGFAPGAALPEAGGLVWNGFTDVGRATLTTHDAAGITDAHWPATAGGVGWSSEVWLELP
jgi:hypothetical protein